MHLVN